MLLGKYRVERVLGMGGMGVVLAATHVQLNERVAIKLLHPDVARDPSRFARFVHEARASSRIRSEHVVRVFDLGSLDDGAPYIAMEFLEGTDLASVVSRSSPIPILAAVDYVLQACEGVAEAHARGIIHRDLKPANLFLTRRGDGSPCVKVLDFGISKMTTAEPAPESAAIDPAAPASLSPTLDGTTGAGGDEGAPRGSPGRWAGWAAIEPLGQSLTRTRGRLGSPRYMSPEQMRSAKHVDVRTDVWALGAILYELVAGRPAFDAETFEELRAMIAATPAPDARAVRPDVPEGIAAAIARCLAKSPEDRFADVGDLASALGPFASHVGGASAQRAPRILGRGDGGATVSLPPIDALGATVDAATGRSRTTAPRRARTGRVVAGVGGLAIALAATFGIVRWRERRASRDAPPVAAVARSPLADLSSRLACVVFDVRAVAPPTGWLGAAAGDLACQRATAFLGERDERTLSPARLLGVPRMPSDQMVDVYSREDVRARSIEAAKASANAYLDGVVSLEEHDDLAVVLYLKRSDGTIVATSSGRGPVLPVAVREAVTRMTSDGALPRTSLDPEYVAWTGVETTEALETLLDLQQLGNDVPTCNTLAERVSKLRWGAAIVQSKCWSQLKRLERTFPEVTIDHSSSQAFNISSTARSDPALDLAAVAAEAEGRLKDEKSRIGQLMLAYLEGMAIMDGTGDDARADKLLLRVLDAWPDWASIWSLLAWREPGPASKYALWVPWSGTAWWTWIGRGGAHPPDDEIVEMYRRAYFFAPQKYALSYANALVQGNHDAEAKAIATRCEPLEPNGRMISDLVLARIEAHRGFFGTATTWMRRALAEYGATDDVVRTRLYDWVVELVTVTGQAPAILDEWIGGLKKLDPEAAERAGPTAADESAIPILRACIRASPRAARDCVEWVAAVGKRTGNLASWGYGDAVEGARLYLNGDYAAAMRAWQPLAGYRSEMAPPAVLIATGSRQELADLLKRRLQDTAMGQLSSLQPTAAKVAYERHDFATARDLAQQVVDRWSSADMPIPAVAEMQALLGRMK
jgi:serine/threonine-protein kinase